MKKVLILKSGGDYWGISGTIGSMTSSMMGGNGNSGGTVNNTTGSNHLLHHHHHHHTIKKRSHRSTTTTKSSICGGNSSCSSVGLGNGCSGCSASTTTSTHTNSFTRPFFYFGSGFLTAFLLMNNNNNNTNINNTSIHNTRNPTFTVDGIHNEQLEQQQQQETTTTHWLRSLFHPWENHHDNNVLQDDHNNDECLIKFSSYKGQEYTVPGVTIGKPKCLIESKFLKVQQHQVVQPSQSSSASASSSSSTSKPIIIPDWIFIDYHERVNVLVEAPNHHEHYLIFEQTKYALENQLSLAIVGGIIEPTIDISSLDTAQREVHEELHVNCTNYIALGRYRTDVNRGMGWTHSYLATNCQYNQNNNHHEQQHQHEDEEDENENKYYERDTTTTTKSSSTGMVGGDDTEQQIIHILSLQQIQKAVQEGKFMEIQWTATIGLAILHLIT